jgi:hypothetical protein
MGPVMIQAPRKTTAGVTAELLPETAFGRPDQDFGGPYEFRAEDGRELAISVTDFSTRTKPAVLGIVCSGEWKSPA